MQGILAVFSSLLTHYCDKFTFQTVWGSSPICLSFASENDLMNIMKLTPGSVTPFGILNDDERKVNFFIDREFTEPLNLIGIHPNENTATVWLKTDDLIKIIKQHGNPISIIDI